MKENNLPPLYSKTSSGKLQIWYVYVNGNAIHVHHGLLDGKKQEKVTYAIGKNVGKSNETTPEQQAILEAKSKWQHQKDRGYFVDKEDALQYVEFAPMRAQNYNDQAKKIVYPVYLQPKLNGMRLMFGKDGKPVSKSGLDLELPKHWVNPLRMLEPYGLLEEGLDGEVYAGLESEGGLSLQEIISAFRKPNDNTHKLEYHVYDIPGAGTFEERTQKLGKLYEQIVKLESEGVKLPIKVVWTGISPDEQEATQVYDLFVKMGYEGAVYRNGKGLYEHGKRSYDLIKRKASVDFEAVVLSVEKDKNGDGVLTCKTVNGKYVGSVFKVMMRIDAAEVNYRKYENAVKLIKQHITVEAEEYSDSGVPTKPRGILVREVENGKPLF